MVVVMMRMQCGSVVSMGGGGLYKNRKGEKNDGPHVNECQQAVFDYQSFLLFFFARSRALAY